MANRVLNPEAQRPTRRAALYAISLALLTARPAGAKTPHSPEPNMPAPNLQTTLRSIGGAVCLAAAKAVEAATQSGGRLSLTLRSADLSPAQTEAVAAGIEALTGPTLISLSLSYSRRMGDAAAIALLDALPNTIESFGLVDCALGDPAGEALLRWARRCTALSMLCVESNRFSTAMRRRISGLADGRGRLAVMV